MHDFWRRNLSRFLKVEHEIAIQPKLSENASSQIGSGSQKLLEIWTWFFYWSIPLSLGDVLDTHNMALRCIFASVELFEVKNHLQNKQKRIILDPEILVN